MEVVLADGNIAIAYMDYIILLYIADYVCCNISHIYGCIMDMDFEAEKGGCSGQKQKNGLLSNAGMLY